MASDKSGHASMTPCSSAVNPLSLLAICWQGGSQCWFSRGFWPSATDSKSGAGLPVAGSSPVPSACRCHSQRVALHHLDPQVTRRYGERSLEWVRSPFSFLDRTHSQGVGLSRVLHAVPPVRVGLL